MTADDGETLDSRMRRLYRETWSDRLGDSIMDLDSWWRSPIVLAELGSLLAGPFRGDAPTVVMAPESSGHLLGPLVGVALGVGFIGVSKNAGTSSDNDPWRIRLTPPDYKDRHLKLGFRRRLLDSTDRVLVVDDLVDTGGQLLAMRELVRDSGATWLGASVLIDNLRDSRLRRDLGIRSVYFAREL